MSFQLLFEQTGVGKFLETKRKFIPSLGSGVKRSFFRRTFASITESLYRRVFADLSLPRPDRSVVVVTMSDR